MKKNLGGVWRFSLENVSHGFFADDIWSKDYDDSQWRRVSVPHDWDGDNFLGERRTADGTDELVEDSGWYRCHFAADGTMGQKRVFVEFGGVSKHCKAWCNGYYLGRHENSLMPFRFDVTDALKGNAQDVVLALKVEQGKASGARWYTGAGIGRPVNIRYVGDCYFEEAGVIFDG
ncbi:MAG: hypothetical protein II711_02595, partial [Clostridia bacterium]|nr:hypothetical protein [Clostridia bacterium]